MKISVEELRSLVREALIEAKKSSKKEQEKSKSRKPAPPTGYQYSEEHDFSKPLGGNNVYKKQGAANFGPWTESKYNVSGFKNMWEAAASYVRGKKETK